MNPAAYFVSRPRRLADLLGPHDLRLEQPCQIVRTVTLAPIDFENFAEDMRQSRAYLEVSLPAAEPSTRACMLIRARGREGAVLVCPGPEGTVEAAAYLAVLP